MNFKVDLMGRPHPTLSVSITHTHIHTHTCEYFHRVLNRFLLDLPLVWIRPSPTPPRGTVKMTMFHHLLFELLLLLLL